MWSGPTDSKLVEKLKDASLLITKEALPPSGLVGLVARARDDQANLIARLYEEARFGATVSIIIAGRKLESISVTDEVSGGSTLPVTITVTPGPEFTFGDIQINGGEGADQEQVVAEAGLVSGEKASTRRILAAETDLVTAWQKKGRPYPEVINHDVVADHATQTVDVTINVKPGPQAVLGEVRVSGTDQLDPEFVALQADIPEGERYHPDILERARKQLAKLEALASVSVRVAERVGPDGRVPVLIEVSERKRRTIGAGVSYSSTEGAGSDVYWMHRNLFGQAETLRFETQIGRLIEADEYEEYDGRVAVLFGKPGVIDPHTRLDLRAMAMQEDPEPYNRRGVVTEGHLTHDFNEHFSLSGGVVYDWARIDDAFGRNYYTLFSTPAVLRYDSRDSLLDPTRGMLAALRAEPAIEVDDTALFLVTDAELRLYYAFDEEERYIIGARGLAGTIYGADVSEIPAHRRFYSGGGGSVRGYDYLNIGPRKTGFGPTGGLTRIEGSLEARIKITDTIGIVPFIDAGYVSETTGFGGSDVFQVGVGLGLRYYSSVGPLRLDVAVPLDPQKGDPDFAVYFGIGQAF
jgi:translocation and assembly module TamA